ncbi:hypothetical protein DFQ04_0394 [Algoriphagus boseongensis]|uniref:Probable inorganic carbon transporter subunit DabA n=1 Tax=Algoriphagus boseongensis TaxID=1442587 RepID=A0A4R6T7F5_9BACT|nr:DUF2309 domain-containing protein [Algoriphagus boseongensis]TDQ18591.1 hypothetical protein DFQ04_0394 [Algoriphagus boseongensis]
MKHHHKQGYGLEEIVHELKHFLPAQAPLKDFVHHNTLHAFQNLPFHQAIKQAKTQLGYKGYLPLETYRELYHEGKIKGQILKNVLEDQFGPQLANDWAIKMFDQTLEIETNPKVGTLRAHWKSDYHFNLDKVTHPFLFRVLSAYLDQGISIWSFPVEASGFLEAIKAIEKESIASLFKSERVKTLLHKENLKLEELLEILVGNEKAYGWYLFDQQFAHPGWSGMVSVLETQPESLLDRKKINLEDMIKFECLLEIDALDKKFGENWSPIGVRFPKDTRELFETVPFEEIDLMLHCWQEAYEWSYYDEVLAGIKSVQPEIKSPDSPSFQAMFCIDDRECSTRRHLEYVDPECATYGTPGFFSVEFYFQPEFGKFYTKSCPAPVTPKYLIKETANHKKLAKDAHFNQNSHSLLRGWVNAQTLGFWSALRLVGNILKPSSSALEVSSFKHMDPKGTLSIEFQGEFFDGLQVGFKIEEMADRIEGLLRSIGLLDRFSPLVYLIGHGASSINNTHYAGYDCGACCGRPGSVNARVAAAMANHPQVRELLVARGIVIPESTQFLGGLHDTTKDEIEYYDEDQLSPENLKQHQLNKLKFSKALDINALERSRRFDTLRKNKSINRLHEAVKKRAFSLFEPRPEYNHATNALCIVSRKSTIKGLFFDRRAFLNSYDYRKDPEGKALTKILGAAAPVCGGINLEYYFSRMDPDKLGAGTKLPHNVMGLIGVANGADGDLRTGLPYQMVEIHDPIRLMLIVEQYPDVVMDVIRSNPATYEWIKNYWVHFVVIDPHTKTFLRFKDEAFVQYKPESTIDHIEHLQDKLLSSKENLPVYLIDSL